MSGVPREPREFFETYAPAHLSPLEAVLKGRSSPGAVVFEITGGGAWSLRFADGKVSVMSGVAPDVLVRLTLAAADFEAVIVAGAERLDDGGGLDRQLMAARVLLIDEERARLLRESPGSLALKLAAPPAEHRLTLTLGAAEPKLEAPDAEIACSLEDLWAIQGGTKNPFELLMDGRIRMAGNIQLAMALGAALGG